MSWALEKTYLEAFAKTFDPSARLAVKRSKLWVGGLKTNATTLGRTVYIARHWTSDQVRRVIPHEVLGHVKQFRYCGLGIHPTLGFPGMALIYVWGVIFFIFLAWGRYRCELHADTVSWRYHLKQRTWGPVQVRHRARQFAKTVSSWSYLKAWPKFWVIWGFKRRAEKVIKEVLP
jgi:hypothetical protein